MFTTAAADGTTIRGYAEGAGPAAILMLGPGLDDGSRCQKLAERLSNRLRVVRLHRRQYRLDLKPAGELDSGCSIDAEVDDVLAVVRSLGVPVLLYGHSSGGVVALEAILRSPSAFAGAVLYEPPLVMPSRPLDGAVVDRARALITNGRTGKAFATFAHETVGLPPVLAWASGVCVAVLPKYRRLARCQIDDLQAIVRLGDRIEAYARIEVPIVLLGGDRSPAHLADRLDALERVLPDVERIELPGRDHAADVKAPDEVVAVIERLADRVLSGQEH